MMKDAVKYAKEFKLDLDLTQPNPTSYIADKGEQIPENKVSEALKKAVSSNQQEEVNDQNWQLKIACTRWDE